MFQTAREKKEELKQKIGFLLIVIGGLLCIGMLFYHLVEGWPLLDALYFSAISLTSRGYSGLAPSTWLSVLFSIFYLLVGAAILIYTISTLVAFYTGYYQNKMQGHVNRVRKIFKKEKPKKNKWLVLTDRNRKKRF